MLDGDFLALALLTSGLSILCSAGPSGHCGVLGSIRGPTHSMAAAPSLPVPMIQDFYRVQRALGASPFPGEKPWVEQGPPSFPSSSHGVSRWQNSQQEVPRSVFVLEGSPSAPQPRRDAGCPRSSAAPPPFSVSKP